MNRRGILKTLLAAPLLKLVGADQVIADDTFIKPEETLEVAKRVIQPVSCSGFIYVN